MSRIAEFRYEGDGQLLESGETYTFYETPNGVEAYPEGSGDPIPMNRGTFSTLQQGKLRRLEGATPMR